MDYAHTYEIDSFHELPPAEVKALPPYIQDRFRLLHRPVKVRVTHEEKTNRQLAAIIKVPIDHIHVFNPKYPFDWRISINAEMNWNGDVESLLSYSRGRDNQPNRRKDRVSYRHLEYSIDLTQVKGGDGTQSHELEVEVSSSKVREFGRKQRETREVGELGVLVKGFLDNVRLLARQGEQRG